MAAAAKLLQQLEQTWNGTFTITSWTLPPCTGLMTFLTLSLQINTYQPMVGQTRCLQCPAGSSTQDEGNTECQPCPIGYYSSSAAAACIAAPKGTYVEDVGAQTYTPW